MNCELLHPLMFIKDLDASETSRNRRKKSKITKRRPAFRISPHYARSHSAGSRNTDNPYNLRPRAQSLKDLSLPNLVLSDSDSTSENEDTLTKPGSSFQNQLDDDDFISDNEDEFLPTVFRDDLFGYSTISSKDRLLLEDLEISSDSSSSSSSSEITGPSESDTSSICQDAAQPLLGNLKGDAYFFIHSNVNPLVYEDLRTVPIDKDPNTIVDLLKLFFRDHSIDKAGLLLVDKLKVLSISKCLNVLRNQYTVFKQKLFYRADESINFLARIVMTLMHYWYARKMNNVAYKLYQFLTSCSIDPLTALPFAGYLHDPINKYNTPKESDIAIMCCDICFDCDDLKSTLKCLLLSFTNFMLRNSRDDIDCLKPFVIRLFHKLIAMEKHNAAFFLFTNIMDVQENIEHPIDLTVFYDAVLGIHIASNDKVNHKLGISLFQKVNHWHYYEMSSISCRGLLLIAALLKVPRRIIKQIFSMCVNINAFPSHNLDKWIIRIYSSMTKVEIQVYIEQCFLAYLREVWSGHLKMCTTCIVFHIEVVSSAPVRDCIYKMHQNIKDVDHSLYDAVRRLKAVIYYYLRCSVDEILHPYDIDKFIVFDGAVKELFKKVLNLTTLERPHLGKGQCPLCK